MVRLPCMLATLRRATRAVSCLYEEEMRRIGLRGMQYSLLRTLSEIDALRPGGAAQGMLAEVIGMDQTTLTRNLRLLARKGWVAIRPGETDRRERIVRLSAAGRAIVNKGFARWQAAQTRFAESMGPSDWRALGELLPVATTAAMKA